MSGCGCDHEALAPFSEVYSRLLAQVSPLTESERVPLEAALGRVLSENIVSALDVPPEDNSAMDGYAFAYEHLPADGRLPISQRIAAGSVAAPLQPGTAARIFTGSEIPPGADTVVMQEDCSVSGHLLTLNKVPLQGANIRPRGQDIRKGEPLLTVGTRLEPAHLGVLASVGINEVQVVRRLKVALLTTGDELVMPGEAVAAGQIYNSNLYTLRGLLEKLGIEVIFPGIVEDTLSGTITALREMADVADCVISSGGVSVGEEDHVKAAVNELGELNIWRLAIKPGKPFAYGQVGGKPFLGLPGNPSAALVTFLLLARPYLLKMQGVEDVEPQRWSVAAAFEQKKSIPRMQFLRVQLALDSGVIKAHLGHTQSSGALKAAIHADGLLEVPPNTRVSPGTLCSFIPFSELMA